MGSNDCRARRGRIWTTVHIALPVAAMAYLAAVPAARCDGLAPSAPADVPNFTPEPGQTFEARFGVFYHREGSIDPNTADISAAIVTPRLNVGAPGYWANLLPRLQIGGNLNLWGKTSYAYADGVITLPITPWLFFEPFLGAAIHNGSLVATPTLSGLGCPVLFHAGVSLGVPINRHWEVMGTFEHLSNGKGLFGVDCGTNQTVTGSNQGLNNYGVRFSYAF